MKPSCFSFCKIPGVLALLCALFPFSQSLAQAPANDSLCNAALLTVDGGCQGNALGDNTDATAEAGEPQPDCFSEGTNSVWYQFVAPATGKVTVTTLTDFTGTNEDTEIALYELPDGDCTSPDQLVEIACAQDIGFFGPFLSTISNASVEPGETYYVQVSGWQGTEGSFCLEVLSVEGPPNDDICDALPIEVGATCDSISGSNTGAGAQAGEPEPGCFDGGVNSVWFTFEGPASGNVRVSTDIDVGRDDANTDTEVALYLAPNDTCALEDLILIACDQDGGDSVSFNSLIASAPAPAGATLYVQVSGWNGTEGTFCLEVTEVPPPPPAESANDTLCNAVPLVVGESVSTPNGNNAGAGFEVGEPAPECFGGSDLQTVWFRFEAPASGLVEISTNSDAGGVVRDTEVALYALPDGDCSQPQNLELLGCNQDGGLAPLDSNAVLFADSLMAGETYYIQVSSNDTTGTFVIEVQEGSRPENDAICDAISLNVDGETALFDNIFATTTEEEALIYPPLAGCQSLEGWCVDTSIQQSVWFEFVAPASGAVLVDLCNDGSTQFDTRVAVYQGDACDDPSSFVLLGANDDDPNCDFSFASRLPVYCLEPGESYYLLVAGFVSAQGGFGINLSELAVQPLTTDAVTEGPYCPGGASGIISLTATGGVEPYAYRWDDGATTRDRVEVMPGTYEVVVNDRCGVADTLVVTVNDDAPLLEVSAGLDDLICLGDTLELGGAPTALSGLPFVKENAYAIDIVSGSLFRHDINTPANTVPLSGTYGESFFAGDFGPDGFYALESDNSFLVKIDTVTGRGQVVGVAQQLEGHSWTGLAWDASSQLFYAVSTDGSTSVLYNINFGDATTIPLRNLDLPVPIWLAINEAGDAYTMDITSDSLYRVDLFTGTSTTLGYIGFDANFAQDADFDPRNGLLFLAAFNAEEEVAELRVAILETGETVSLGPIGDGQGQISAFGISGHNFTGSYSYAWEPTAGLLAQGIANPRAVPDETTSYVLSVSDACGSTVRDTVVVGVSDPEVAFEVVSDDGIGNGQATALPEGGVPPYAYLWSNGDTTATADSLAAGTYTVTVTDDLGCVTVDTVSLTITNLNDPLAAGLSQWRVFPNPHAGTFSISVDLQQRDALALTVFDSKGARVSARSFSDVLQVKTDFALGALPKGVYLLQARTSRGVAFKRMVVH